MTSVPQTGAAQRFKGTGVQQASSRPEISILVPAKDEAENLPLFMEQASAAFASAPQRYEVIVDRRRLGRRFMERAPAARRAVPVSSSREARSQARNRRCIAHRLSAFARQHSRFLSGRSPVQAGGHSAPDRADTSRAGRTSSPVTRKGSTRRLLCRGSTTG